MKRALVCTLVAVTAIAAGGVVWSAGRGAGRDAAAGDDATLPTRPAASHPLRAVAAGPAAGPPATVGAGRKESPTSRPMSPTYAILLQRSLFAARGHKAAKGQADAAADAVADRPESEYVLRGVSQQAGRFDAFVEVLGGSRLLRLHPGDLVARGRIRRVGFDGVEYVEYEAAGQSTRVVIGQDLTGKPGPAARDRGGRAGRAGRAGDAEPTSALAAEAGGDEGRKARGAAERPRRSKGE